MKSANDLRKTLQDLDGKSYGALKSIRGSYAFDRFTLVVDHVQGDPFAAPSRLRARVPWKASGFGETHSASRWRRIALCDYLTRQAHRVAGRTQKNRGSGASGSLTVARPGQEILERTSVVITEDAIELRFEAGLPAFGRRIAGQQGAALLTEDVPAMVNESLFADALDADALERHLATAEDAAHGRQQVRDKDLVAFIADDSILPRRSGVDERPLSRDEAIPFDSPDSLRTHLDLPNAGRVEGMGVPRGISLIVGGGYHGKSTLLTAIERGVHAHIPGDGREQVFTDNDAVKIRAEDGRSVKRVDISRFIANLPLDRDTTAFSTPNASGSTSQAAAIVEAVEAGAHALLIDEDTSATNLMVRDAKMQALVAPEDEPITPFLDRVQQLWQEHGLSTVLVMGGSGDYFAVADTVIALHAYRPGEATDRARRIIAEHPADRATESSQPFGPRPCRVLPSPGIQGKKGKPPKIRTRGTRELSVGDELLSLAAMEQVVDRMQTETLAHALLYAQQHLLDDRKPLPDVLDDLMATIEARGLDVLTPHPGGHLAATRRHEIAAALNRLRGDG